MNTNKTIQGLTATYVEQALGEVKLLHDPELVEPTLKKFNIERRHARLFGFSPKPGKFRPRVGMRPRPVYSVLNADGSPLGEPIHEGDLGAQYAETVIEGVIAANLAEMLADHADLVALHRAGDGGAAPSFRYKPASALSERSDTLGDLERKKNKEREAVEELREQHEDQQHRLREVQRRVKEAENALACTKTRTRQLFARENEAQHVIDRAARIREREALRQGALPSPWETDASAKGYDGPELG